MTDYVVRLLIVLVDITSNKAIIILLGMQELCREYNNQVSIY